MNSTYREIVANQVPVALSRVELQGKTTRISDPVWRALGPCDKREARNDIRPFAHCGEHVCKGEAGDVFGDLRRQRRGVL